MKHQIEFCFTEDLVTFQKTFIQEKIENDVLEMCKYVICHMQKYVNAMQWMMSLHHLLFVEELKK